MDAKTLAYINLNAILGSIPRLCEMVPEAKKLIDGKDVSIGFDVKDGPAGTLVFNIQDAALFKANEPEPLGSYLRSRAAPC